MLSDVKRFALAFPIVFASACALYAPDTTIARVPLIDSGSDVVETSVDAPVTCPPGEPSMVNVGAFCIDSTEVTKAQYAAWLDTKPLATPSTQQKECNWNTSFAPELRPDSDHKCTADVIDPKKDPNNPVVCIDWCDAMAYCRAHDRRLCGRIAGGSEDIDAVAALKDPKVNQWSAACNGTYPYGPIYDPAKCNGQDKGVAAAVPVASLECHGKGAPWASIYDMSGNVAEWVDACQPSGTPTLQSCQTRGGTFLDISKTLACDSLDIAKPRSWFDDHIGFRCCSP